MNPFETMITSNLDWVAVGFIAIFFIFLATSKLGEK